MLMLLVQGPQFKKKKNENWTREMKTSHKVILGLFIHLIKNADRVGKKTILVINES